MPLYMDIHNLDDGTTAEDVAKAHAKDMETQKKYGVEYGKYWVSESGKKVFAWPTRQMQKQRNKSIVKRTG
jgi:Nickel responsive protein SCO4226-like